MFYLGRFFQREKSLERSYHPQVTWAAKSLNTAASRTGVFLKKQIWIWPVIAAALLAMLGTLVSRLVETTMKDHLRSELQTLLSVETAMLDNWANTNSANAASIANSDSVRESIFDLLESLQPAETGTPPSDPEALRRRLNKQIGPMLASHDYVGFFVADRTSRIVASTNEELIGRQGIAEYEAALARALKGETTICPPFASVVTLKDGAGRTRTGVPVMLVVAPVRSANFEIVATLALRIRPELEFTRIMQLGRFGESGETYAFDKSGVMVSNSRFDEDMILAGILPDREDAQSILNVSLRDPGGNMPAGFRPKVRRSEQPFTKGIADGIAGSSGVDIEGYRDYRAVPTLGAWKWLPAYQLGVMVEIDRNEAYRPLAILEWTFRGLLGLLAISSLAIFLFTIRVANLQREAQKAVIELKQLGQYTIEDKIGAGGMGIVYKGHHAMLRRPTAVKMLSVDKVNDSSIQRFEREVQITCQLNHPNTIAIYDYGRTPEGVFYYAMEYLDGIDLQTLVEKYGPQPEARVVDILLQVCGSLYEAHSLGLVHRDIKPANIMLNRRGAETDVVKVLDFGLVKAVDDAKQAGLTSAGSLTGTPLYMAPEAIQSPNSVDARSDLYAVGAAGYFLLTGHPVFEADSLVQLCKMHIDASPVSPSKRLGRTISRQLEDTILSLLNKKRTNRPQTARDLALQLQQTPTTGHWTTEAADSWWDLHQRGLSPASLAVPSSPITSQSSYDHTIVTNSLG